MEDALQNHGNVGPMPGVGSAQHERMVWLVDAVGGQLRAAKIANVSADTMNNWRKADARLALGGALALCTEVGLPLDWLATGYMVRPDIAALSSEDHRNVQAISDDETGLLVGFVRLLPVRPQSAKVGGIASQRWDPSPIAVSESWLEETLGVKSSAARYAVLDDDGLSPRLNKGALAIVDISGAEISSGAAVLVAGAQLLARRYYPMPDGKVQLTADGDPNWRFNAPAGALIDTYPIIWSGQRPSGGGNPS